MFPLFYIFLVLFLHMQDFLSLFFLSFLPPPSPPPPHHLILHTVILLRIADIVFVTVPFHTSARQVPDHNHRLTSATHALAGWTRARVEGDCTTFSTPSGDHLVIILDLVLVLFALTGNSTCFLGTNLTLGHLVELPRALPCVNLVSE